MPLPTVSNGPGPSIAPGSTQAPGLSATWTDSTGVALTKPDGTSFTLGGSSSTVVYATYSTPSALAAGTTNDFALPANVVRIRFSADSTGSTLTGITAGLDGQLIVIQNISAYDLTLSPEDSGSTAANRFALNGTLLLGANQSLAMMYDSGISRWTAWGI